MKTMINKGTIYINGNLYTSSKYHGKLVIDGIIIKVKGDVFFSISNIPQQFENDETEDVFIEDIYALGIKDIIAYCEF